MGEDKKFKSKLVNCEISSRDGETLFLMKDDKVYASLEGYAIFPVEDYKTMKFALGLAEKTLCNSDVSGASKNVRDLKAVGDRDLFKLLYKVHSKAEGWMKSTKAMEIPGVGCIVQVTTQQGDNVAEALVNVPGVKIVDDPDHEGGRKLVPWESEIVF